MDNITDEQIKKIIKDIIDEECKKYNLETTVYVITPLEYFYKITEGKKMKIFRVNDYINAVISAPSGFFTCETNEIVVHHKVGTIKKYKNLMRLIFTTYHELRHAYQETLDDYTYEKFLLSIEDMEFSEMDYNVNHNEYSFEIGADLYSIQKTKEYLLKNYPQEYENNKEYLKIKEQKVKFLYMTYDAADLIERKYQKLKRKMKINFSKRLDIESMDEISPILKIFWNENLSYKKISEIIKDENFNKLDKRIVYAFFSSRTFLETLNVEALTDEELSVLSESLEYTKELYQRQLKILMKEKDINSETLKFLLNEVKNLVQKINIIGKYYYKSILRKINPERSKRKRIKHMKTIPPFAEKVMNERKRRGYITINTFYILGLFISISTIIYLLLK